MRISGLQKLSLIDYPDKVSAVVFTQGCNFRCPYCYNPELAFSHLYGDCIPLSKVREFLQSRKEYLDGVVVSGGEPTQQKDLIPFMKELKNLEYSLKLDTNGSRPQVLKKLIDLKLVDYIAMDIKAPLNKYCQVVAASFPIQRIKESTDILLHSGIDYEFRTTVVKSLLSPKDLDEIASFIDEAKRYTIQKFMPSDKILDTDLLEEDQYTDEEIDEFRKKWEKNAERINPLK